ncbi:hypothetical protein BCV73_01125 [Paenibacillus sp. SSG-1]|nr:hypothetical protein BCV73_01125 [Paenibacillus sp. SSG-1]
MELMTRYGKEGISIKQIIAMGGGGFSMEPDNPLLDLYIGHVVETVIPTVYLGEAGRAMI